MNIRLRLLFSVALGAISMLNGCIASKHEPTVRLEQMVQNGKLSPVLLEILKVTKITHNDTLQSVVEATQKEWIRKPGSERWEMDNAKEELSPALLPLFSKLGNIDEIAPTQKHYTYGIILGATANSMRQRLAYAIEIWKKGIHFDHLVFLVGERPLDKEKESEAVLFDTKNEYLPARPDWKKPEALPKTETDAAKMIFDQAVLPKDFKDKVKVTFIDTPMQKNNDGTVRRPNTGDTVKLFKPMVDKQPGSILAVSHQPYVGYQDAVMRTLLPEYRVETVGSKAVGTIHIGVALDNLARWLYQENQYQQSLKK